MNRFLFSDMHVSAESRAVAQPLITLNKYLVADFHLTCHTDVKKIYK